MYFFKTSIVVFIVKPILPRDCMEVNRCKWQLAKFLAIGNHGAAIVVGASGFEGFAGSANHPKKTTKGAKTMIALKKETADNLKRYLIGILEHEVNLTTEMSVCDRLGVARGTVSRWIRGERAFDSLEQAIMIIQKLGGNVAEALLAIGETNLAIVFGAVEKYPSAMVEAAKILTESDTLTREKLLSELQFLGDRTQKTNH